MKLLLLKTYWNLDSQNILISKELYSHFLDSHCISCQTPDISLFGVFCVLLECAVKSAVFYQAMGRTIGCSCSTKAPKTRVLFLNHLICTFRIFCLCLSST